MSALKINIIAILFALSILLASSVQACQREIGTTAFSITPVEGTATARADSVDCQSGVLSYYDPNQGWLEMFDQLGHPIGAHDINGIETPWGLFLVAVLQDYSVVMRYGHLLDQLVRLFGAHAGRPNDMHLMDWSGEVFTAGAGDEDFLGSHPDYGHPALATRAARAGVVFAGAETISQSGGLIEGALLAGEHAAQTVLRGL